MDHITLREKFPSSIYRDAVNLSNLWEVFATEFNKIESQLILYENIDTSEQSSNQLLTIQTILESRMTQEDYAFAIEQLQTSGYLSKFGLWYLINEDLDNVKIYTSKHSPDTSIDLRLDTSVFLDGQDVFEQFLKRSAAITIFADCNISTDFYKWINLVRTALISINIYTFYNIVIDYIVFAPATDVIREAIFYNGISEVARIGMVTSTDGVYDYYSLAIKPTHFQVADKVEFYDQNTLFNSEDVLDGEGLFVQGVYVGELNIMYKIFSDVLLRYEITIKREI